MSFASSSRSVVRQGVKRACLQVQGQVQVQVQVQVQRPAMAGSLRAASGAPPAAVDPPVSATVSPPSPHAAPVPASFATSSSASTTPSPTPTPSPSSSSSSTSTYLDFPPLQPLPRPFSTHVATLRLASYHPAPLTLFTSFALHSAASLGIPTSGAAYLPTVTSLYTVPKSPFVHKKSQENFQRKEHKRVVKVYDAQRESVDLWLRYLKQHAVGGVGMRAEVYEWVEAGQVGREVRALEGELGGEGGQGGARAGESKGNGDGNGKSNGRKAETVVETVAETAKGAADKVKGVVDEVKAKAEELVKELSK